MRGLVRSPKGMALIIVSLILIIIIVISIALILIILFISIINMGIVMPVPYFSVILLLMQWPVLRILIWWSIEHLPRLTMRLPMIIIWRIINNCNVSSDPGEFMSMELFPVTPLILIVSPLVWLMTTYWVLPMIYR